MLFTGTLFSQNNTKTKKMTQSNFETITLGGGCYWCVEAVYENLKGVKSVVSGFSGGKITNPSYEEVCSGTTGHAEVVQITFDKNVTKECKGRQEHDLKSVLTGAINTYRAEHEYDRHDDIVRD